MAKLISDVQVNSKNGIVRVETYEVEGYRFAVRHWTDGTVEYVEA
jgi:hypothetical protein